MDMFPAVSELTVAQAAKILDGTEGLINELLEDGLLKFRLDNGKRLVQWDSLEEFLRQEQRSNAIVAEMIQMNRELGLYDD